MEPSDALLEGRRRLESISGYELLEDLTWDKFLQRWIFKFRLIGNYSKTDWVPRSTVWYCLISEHYPFGEIEICPDAQHGINVTFPHMRYNEKIDNRPWLSGNICVKTSFGLWGKSFFNNEPFDAPQRLHWNIKRSQAWIAAAVSGQLTQQDDPFELPHFPRLIPIIWAFNENAESFKIWSDSDITQGILSWKRPDFNPAISTVTKYEAKGKSVLTYSWGTAIDSSKGIEGLALWYRLPEMPVVPPWQIPTKWNELFIACKGFGIDIEAWLMHQLGDRRMIGQINYLSLGFPVPEVFGGSAQQMHWFTAKFERPKPLSGFRNNNHYSKFQTKIMFQKNPSINWVQSENWAKHQITSRGIVNEVLDKMNIAIIGTGSIGSAVAELLVRLGCQRITLVDKDELTVGNFSRHTLTMNSLPLFKATQLAKHLNSIFPFTQVLFENDNLEVCLNRNNAFLNKFDLILDATANDSVLALLDRILRNKQIIFASLSTSIDAKRLYCFMAKSDTTNLFETFQRLMQPWEEKQSKENPLLTFPLENIGCWHPIFPARLDDIWGVLSPAIRQIEYFVQQKDNHCLTVIERQSNASINVISNM